MKTNRLALLSYYSSLIILLTPPVYLIAIFFVLKLSPPPENPWVDHSSGYGYFLLIILFLEFIILGPCAFITGMLALVSIHNHPDTEKGKKMAWIGILFGIPATICSALIIWNS